jgi:1-acyl-sn-glycerol-3-phosphate acyltransferase
MASSDIMKNGPSTRTLIQGFLMYHALVLTSAFVNLTVLVGPFLYPKTVGLLFVLPYFSYTLFVRRDELKDGAHWPRFSIHFWMFTVMRQFLQLEIAPIPKELADEETKQGAQFLIGVFPHGSWADYRVLMDGMLPEVFPNISGNIKTLAASVLFRMPLIREMSLWTGCVDASRAVAARQLDQGQSLLILPGGEAEQIRTAFGKEIVYVNARKGFIKLAMTKGVPAVPCYAFGCSDYYRTSSFVFDVRVALIKNLGVCVPLAAGFLGSPCCPLPVKTTIVFGKPIHFDVKEKGLPTLEELDLAHSKFIVALKLLFDEHKTKLGYEARKLEIV